MEEFKLFDAEYKFLDIIWKPEPVNSNEAEELKKMIEEATK